MQNNFGEMIQGLRKEKFPGLSLRKVGDHLTDEHGFKKFFYTQLNKIELGFVLPSSELLSKLLDAYKASNKEREAIVTEYTHQLTGEKVRMVAEDTKVEFTKLGAAVLNRKRPNKK
jgi:hypothetical protein